LLATFCIGSSTIADNDLDSWVAAQPVGEELGSAIIEQVDRPMPLQVEKQGAISPLLASERNVIDAKNSRTTLALSIGECVEQTEQRVRADWHTNFTCRRAPPSPPACGANVVSSSVAPAVRRA
jgi:hypothetical protein